MREEKRDVYIVCFDHVIVFESFDSLEIFMKKYRWNWHIEMNMDVGFIINEFDRNDVIEVNIRQVIWYTE